MNADQIVQQFGKDHLPRNVQDAFSTPSRRYDMAFDVWWLVMPNDSKRNGPSNKDMPFQSLYWVDGQDPMKTAASSTPEALKNAPYWWPDTKSRVTTPTGKGPDGTPKAMPSPCRL